jgi:Phi29 scaffolding protein
MALMDREKHEQLLNELLNTEIDISRKTEILQELRVDHVTGHSKFEEYTKTTEKLQRDNDDLIISNSKLFRQLGTVGGNEEHKKVEEEKQFSETVTLEALEKGV